MNSDNEGSGDQPQPVVHGPQSVSLHEALDGLSLSASGLAFIYSALELLAARFGLSDAVIVLDNETVGTQIFRLGGRAVSKSFASRPDIVRGLYCEPPIVAADDLELVWSACQRALSLQQSHLVESKESSAGVESGPVGDEAPRSAAQLGLLASERAKTAGRDLLRFFDIHSLSKSSRGMISQTLVLVDVVTFVLTMANVHGPVRYVLGLILGVVIPGWSVVGLINLKNAALELSLTIASSLAMVMIAAQLLITFHLWHPIVLEEFTCLVCVPSLMLQSVSRSSHPSDMKSA
jgi:hypothetical protein